MNMTLDIECEDQDGTPRDVRVTLSYSPERPAPKASTPDSPGFSDPGDGAFCQIFSAYYTDTPRPQKADPFFLESELFQEALHEKAEKEYARESKALPAGRGPFGRRA